MSTGNVVQKYQSKKSSVELLFIVNSNCCQTYINKLYINVNWHVKYLICQSTTGVSQPFNWQSKCWCLSDCCFFVLNIECKNASLMAKILRPNYKALCKFAYMCSCHLLHSRNNVPKSLFYFKIFIVQLCFFILFITEKD